MIIRNKILKAFYSSISKMMIFQRNLQSKSLLSRVDFCQNLRKSDAIDMALEIFLRQDGDHEAIAVLQSL